MSNTKITTGVSIRPDLVEKIDRLAQSCGRSRSETICRIMEVVVSELVKPNVGWIQVERNHLMQILTI